MKKAIKLFTVVASLAALTACSSGGDVVKTDAGNITKEEFYQKLKASNGSTVLQQMVDEKILSSKYSVKDSELIKEVEKIKSQFKTDAEFKQALSSNGIKDEVALKEQVKANLLQYKAITDGIEVTDKKLQDYYNTNKEKFFAAKGQHILVATQEEANKAKLRIEKGEDFGKVAKEVSTDTGSGANGGDLGEFGKGQMVPEFDKVAFSIELNKLSEPVKTQYGFHIIKITERKQKSFDEAKQAVKNDYLKQNAKDYKTVMAKLKKDAHIEVTDKDLKDQIK